MNFIFFVRFIFLLYAGTDEEEEQPSSYQHFSSPVKYGDSATYNSNNCDN